MDWKTPGIYPQEVFLSPPAALPTGVPAFLGFTQPEATVPPESPQRLTHWEQFALLCGPPPAKATWPMRCRDSSSTADACAMLSVSTPPYSPNRH